MLLKDQLHICVGSGKNALVDLAEADFHVDACGGGSLDLGEVDDSISY